MIGLFIFIAIACFGGLVTIICITYKIGWYDIYGQPPTATPIVFDTRPPVPVVIKPPMPTKQESLYNLAKSSIGVHLSLDETVPWMVGCAEAVSSLLLRFGAPGMPLKGIQGTPELLHFLQNCPAFKAANTYIPGNIIVCPTERNAQGAIISKVRGHVGICGKNSIMSNNSETGKWDTQWDIQRWTDYYNTYGGIPIYYFEPV